MEPEISSKELYPENRPHRIDFEGLFFKFRYILFFFLLGIVLVGLGLFAAKNKSTSDSKIEILNNQTANENLSEEVIVEISGEVEKPGVYKLAKNSRVEDLLIAAGGLSNDADREWINKSLNRAAKLIDGQKIYIPKTGESTLGKQTVVKSANNSGGDQSVSSTFLSQGSGLININTASEKELDTLYGIGPVYAQNIIEHRPYSNIEELVSKGVLKKSTFEKIKNNLTVN